MRIDMHVHVIGNGKDIQGTDSDVYFNRDTNSHWFTRILYTMLENELIQYGAPVAADQTISAQSYLDLLYGFLASSKQIDGIVLLALDAPFAPDTHLLDKDKTTLWVSNRYLAPKVRELNDRLTKEGYSKKFFFGASVNPNRPEADWKKELDYVINHTDAVLLKWIPSVQHIQMKSVDAGFFKMLKDANLPLLCHVGPEYSFPEGIYKAGLDHFEHLKIPLDQGVKVIAAHCATPVFPLIDKNYIQAFYNLMESTNQNGKIRLWADTAALSLSTRIPFMPKIVETFNKRNEWLVNGSDFPIPIDGWQHLPLITANVTFEEYSAIFKEKNPFDRDILIKNAHGLSDSIVSNAETVLRMPKLAK